jgi:hypothetical protein
MPELLKATSSAIDDALRGDDVARGFAERLKAIMAQVVGPAGETMVIEMQNKLIALNGGSLDRYAAVALMILVAQNSIAEWMVEDETGPTLVGPSDPRFVAVEAIQRVLLHKARAERTAERLRRANGADMGHA